jgi:hypothetical protein
MENLRYMLSQYNSKTALLLGHRFIETREERLEGFMAGFG